MDPFQPTGECFVGAASNGEQVLDDVLTVGGLATTTLAQQDNGLVLASGQEVPIGSLRHAVNVRGSVLPSAALEHLHHLERRQRDSEGEDRIMGRGLYISITVLVSLFDSDSNLIFCYAIRDVSLYAQGAAYLLGVHRWGANGVNDHHVGPSVGVHQVTAVPLPQRVHHARLIQILQRGQVLHSVKHRRVCLEFKVRSGHILTPGVVRN